MNYTLLAHPPTSNVNPPSPSHCTPSPPRMEKSCDGSSKRERRLPSGGLSTLTEAPHQGPPGLQSCGHCQLPPGLWAGGWLHISAHSLYFRALTSSLHRAMVKTQDDWKPPTFSLRGCEFFSFITWRPSPDP